MLKNVSYLILTAPNKGYTKPAPALSLTSWIRILKFVGTPFKVGSAERDKGVFAIQTGNLPNPWNQFDEII